MTIRLDRIVTRSGDGGMTSLADGTMLRKSDALIETMGTIDELNAVTGMLACHIKGADCLRRIQNTLFDMGALLCVPGRKDERDVLGRATLWLESEIERVRDKLAALDSFVLPGGTVAAAWAHMARTVARRAERALVGLDQERLVPAQIFLNRLSDYFFVLARHQNDDGASDLLWVTTV